MFCEGGIYTELAMGAGWTCLLVVMIVEHEKNPLALFFIRLNNNPKQLLDLKDLKQWSALTLKLKSLILWQFIWVRLILFVQVVAVLTEGWILVYAKGNGT